MRLILFSPLARPETTIPHISLKSGEVLTAISPVQAGALKMLRGSIIIHFGQFEVGSAARLVVVIIIEF